MREDITKHHLDSLPEVKGWEWSVTYFTEHPSIGNVSLYLRNKQNRDATVYTYLVVSPSCTVEEVAHLMEYAGKKLVQWVTVYPGDTKGYTPRAYLEGDVFTVTLEAKSGFDHTRLKTKVGVGAENAVERVMALMEQISAEEVVPSNLTGGK